MKRQLNYGCVFFVLELIQEAIAFISDQCVISECCGIVTTRERNWINRALEVVSQ